MFLTKEQILNKDDLEKELVKVWGGEVYVRGLTGRERDEFEEKVFLNKEGDERQQRFKNFRAELVSRTVVDDKNKRLFNTSDIEKLGNKSARELSKLFEVAQRLSGLGKEDIDDLTKNSKTTL